MAFFERFIEEINHVGRHKTKLYEVLDELSQTDPHLPHSVYLESAVILLNYSEKSFIESRSTRFFGWLLQKLSVKNKHFYPRNSSCQIDMFSHVVSFPFQSKEVLGFFIELPHLSIDLAHLKELISPQLSDVTFVEGASFSVPYPQRGFTTLYLELQNFEKTFSKSVAHGLKKTIARILTDFLAKPQLDLQIPGNYEFLIKTFRWIMSEIAQGDPIHVFIDFTRQTPTSFHFAVLICRVKNEKGPSFDQELNHPQIHIEERILEKSHNFTKEGIILTVEIPRTKNLTPGEARNQTSQLIASIIGPFRDFNGGLLEKIEENFSSLKKEFPVYSEFLVDFFLSITPEYRQATLPVSALKTLYEALKRRKNDHEEMSYAVEKSKELITVVIKIPHGEFESKWKKYLTKALPSVIFASLNTTSTAILSSSFFYPTVNESLQLQKLAYSFYTEWTEKKEIKQVLTLCSTANFISFDPRIGTEEETSYLHKMLFEGLMRIGPSGNPEPAIAEKVEVSADGRHYRFFLRKSFWSNGLPLTAHDFVYSWSMSLNPGFSAPLTYLFYSIENAQEVKQGSLSSSKLGINALSDHVLDIKLRYATSYFLELLTLALFSPICRQIDLSHPSWVESEGGDYVCNGPFTLAKKVFGKQVVLEKNPHYWDSQDVQLEQVSIPILSEEESLDLFCKKQVDALLFPFVRRQDLFDLDKTSTVQLEGVPLIRYLCLNCLTPPFNNKKLRKALSLVLNRKVIAHKFSKDAKAHYSLFSPVFSQIKNDPNQFEDLSLGKKLFLEILDESPFLQEVIKNQTIYVWQPHKNLALILAEEINATLDLNWQVCVLDDIYSQQQFVDKKHFIISIWSWMDRVNDPCYLLSLFSSNSHLNNLSSWTSSALQSVIDKLNKKPAVEKRYALHKVAEEILLEELPMIPLFYSTINSLHHPYVKNIYTNTFHAFDIRHAHK